MDAADIRRSDRGRRLIRRVVQKACDLETLAFPENPTFDSTTRSCTIKKMLELTLHDFVQLSPKYFQCIYFACRNGEQYGDRVHSDLEKIMKDLRADPPSRNSFVNLVKDFHTAKLGGKINV